MIASKRTYYCPTCRKFTRLPLPTRQRNCGHCGESFLFPLGLYRGGDFANITDPKVIGNWLKVMKARSFGLSKEKQAAFRGQAGLKKPGGSFTAATA